MSVAGLVLAGGSSRRFGGDKLAAELDGRPLLEHVLAAVATVSDVVVIALATDGPEPDLVAPAAVRLVLVRDERTGDGPLVGLAAALDGAERAGAERAVVVGGDMPWIRPVVLRALLAALDDPEADACEPVVDGAPRPLPAALRVEPASRAARVRLAAGGRSLAGLFDGLRTVELPGSDWRAMDPDGDSFRDVDRPGDLVRPGHAETGDLIG